MAGRLDIAAMVLALTSAGGLYVIKHDTRQLEARVQAKERAADRAQSDIAVLAAERAWLGRPERIEQFARGMGLVPISEQQYLAVEHPAGDGIAGILRSSNGGPSQ